MKILLSSNGPHTPTGYGGQAKLMATAFERLGHELEFFSWFGIQGAAMDAGSYRLWPQLDHDFGGDAVIIAKHVGADVVLTLQDIWVLPNNFAETLDGTPWIAYFPVDSEPLSPSMRRLAQSADYPVVFSQFASEQLAYADVFHTYIPHAIHPFYRMVQPEQRQRIRAGLGLRDKQMVFGMVAANKGYPSRKSFWEALVAFARFREAHPAADARLYLHTDPVGNGAINLHYMVEDLDLEEFVSFPDRVRYRLGDYSEQDLTAMYNAIDCLLVPSMGEGFGLPIVEAQVCGTPVIVHDCSSMPELVRIGRSFPRGQSHYTPLRAIQFIPNPDDIVDAMHKEWVSWAAFDFDRESHRTAATAIAEEFSIKRIAETFWGPFLQRVAADIGVE